MPPSSQRLFNIISQATLAFVCSALVVRPLTSGYTIGLELNLLLQLLSLFAVLLWVCGWILRREFRFDCRGVGWPLAVYVLAIVLSLHRASCLILAAATAFDWLVDVLLFLLILQLAAKDSNRRVLERVFLGTALVVALYGILQRFKGFPEMKAWITEKPQEAKEMLGIPDPQNWSDLLSRLNTDEVFSTFVIPNALAGYFLVVIPVMIAHLLARGRPNSARGAAACCVNTVVLICVFWADLLTGAKGAWACLLVQGIVFLYLMKGEMSDKWRRLGMAGLAAIIVAGFITVATLAPMEPAGHPILERLRGYAFGLWDSLHVRFGYWETTRHMLASDLNWLLGVGVNNFQEHYPLYKTVTASEVQKAHNHYLQLWAETGAAGLIGFCLVWILAVRSVWKGSMGLQSPNCSSSATSQPQSPNCSSSATPEEKSPNSPSSATPPVVPWAGAALGFFTISLYADPFKSVPDSKDYLVIALLLFAAWTLYYVLDNADSGGAGNGPEDAESTRSQSIRRAGYLSGVCGLLLHSVIDFDLYVTGCAQSLWIVAAFALAMSGSGNERRWVLTPVRQVAFMLAGVTVFVFLYLFVFSRLADAITFKMRAQQVFGEARKELHAPARARGLAEAASLLESAAHSNPWEPDIFFDRHLVHENLWDLSHDPEQAESAVLRMQRAIELAPFRSGYHHKLALFLEKVARASPETMRDRILPLYPERAYPESAPEIYLPALIEHRAARDLYPSKPEVHLPEADLLWALGLKTAAVVHYRRALDLNEQIHPRWKNLKLDKKTEEFIDRRVNVGQ